MEEILALAQTAARQAGEIAQKVRASGILGLNMKGELDLCTQADLQAEKSIIDCIRQKYPEHSILSEESNASLIGRDLWGPLWIIDPIDGTTNFAHGHKQVGVSIAYAEGGVVRAGVVHAPFLNETFTSIKGQGAKLNGCAIAVSKTDKLKSALVATGFPYDRSNIEPLIARVRNVLSHCRDLRRLGAASLDICWVACGRLDIYYEDVSPWDMAAACLIAKEAGAQIGYFSELPENLDIPKDLYSTGLVVANPHIIDQALAILRA